MGKYLVETRLFQALAHPVRLQILEALACQPLCVCDLMELTGRRQAYISQHLAPLRLVGLVSCERTGWNVCYSLNLSRLADALQALPHLVSSPSRVSGALPKPQGKKTR